MMGEKNERSDLLVRSRMTKVIDPLDDPDKLGDLDDLEDFVGRSPVRYIDMTYRLSIYRHF